jgi:hypothetical protein
MRWARTRTKSADVDPDEETGTSKETACTYFPEEEEEPEERRAGQRSCSTKITKRTEGNGFRV